MSSEGTYDPAKAVAASQSTAEMWRKQCGELYRINAALLEALEELVSRQRECGVECEVTMDLTVKARAAIAQAKGESNG